MSPKDTAFDLLRFVVAQILQQIGFESCHHASVQVLTELTFCYLKSILQHCGGVLCENSARIEMNLFDAAVGSMELSVDFEDLNHFLRSWLVKVHVAPDDASGPNTAEHRAKCLEKWFESSSFNNLDPASFVISKSEVLRGSSNVNSNTSSILLPPEIATDSKTVMADNIEPSPETLVAIGSSSFYPSLPKPCKLLPSSEQQEFLQSLFTLKRKRHIDMRTGMTGSSIALERVVVYKESQKYAQMAQANTTQLVPEVYSEFSERRKAINFSRAAEKRRLSLSLDNLIKLSSTLKRRSLRKPHIRDLAGSLLGLDGRVAAAAPLFSVQDMRPPIWEIFLQTAQTNSASTSQSVVVKTIPLKLGPASPEKITSSDNLKQKLETPSLSAEPIPQKPSAKLDIDVVSSNSTPKAQDNEPIKPMPVRIKMSLGHKAPSPLAATPIEPTSEPIHLEPNATVSPTEMSPNTTAYPKVKKLKLSFGKKFLSSSSQNSTL